MTWWLPFLVALIPIAVGAIYYNPNVVGNIWMRASGLDEEKLKGGNMLLIFGLSYLFSLLVTMMLTPMVIHQAGVGSILMAQEGWGVAGSEVMVALETFDAETGFQSLHRSFGHGAFHGGMAGLVFVGGILAVNALFERRPWNYVLVHVGYWTITLALMGGVLCEFFSFGL